MRIAVLVSGTGTLLEAMIAADVPIELVVSDRPCAGLGIAETAGIEALLVERDSFGPDFDRDRYSKQVADSLVERSIDLVAMAGFGTVFTQPMHDVFGGRMVNTHPALLPAFKGWHAVREALAYGVKVTGWTLHVAELEVDTGPILAQEPVRVLDDDTEDSLHERIKEVERREYPAVLHAIIARGSVLP